MAARRDGAYPTEDVLAPCRELKKKGYKLALDDVVAEARIEPWLDVVDMAKVDFLSADLQTLKVLATRCKERKIEASRTNRSRSNP